MTQELVDALVVGGGPIGCYTANLLALQGRDVRIIEEHRDIGWPMQCAGLISTRVFNILQFPRAKNAIQNEVRGARVFSPKGRSVDILAEKTKAYVVDRNLLDKEIAMEALDNGAKLQIGTRAVGVTRRGKNVEVSLEHDGKSSTLGSKLLIGADGAQSSVAKWFDLNPPQYMFSSFEAEAANVVIPDDMVLIFLSQKLAPGFFAWAIPLDKETARIGLASYDQKQNSRYYFNKFIGSKVFKKAIGWDRRKPPQPTKLMTGSIPLGLVDKMYTNNVMLVGDTAGFPKPASGGGIYTGLISATCAAEAAQEAFKKDKFDERVLKVYQKKAKRKIGSELRNTLILRRVYMGVTNDQIEEGFDILNDPELIEYISKNGDIDYPFRLGKKILKKMPRFFRFVGPFLRGTILGN
jgi:geranylgeranyl reductase family protein